MVSTNKTSLFIPFFIMNDFVLFVVTVQFLCLNVILYTCATVMCNKHLVTDLHPVGVDCRQQPREVDRSRTFLPARCQCSALQALFFVKVQEMKH